MALPFMKKRSETMARYLKKKEKKPRAMVWILGIAIVAIIAGGFLYENLLPNLNEGTTVETPYCTLYYPEKWSDQVSVEITEKPVYRVSYYAVFSAKRPIRLFDISFDDKTGNSAGMIQADDGNLITVCVSVATQKSDTKLTEEERNIVQEMKDDLNNILEQIPFVVNLEETEPTQLPETEPVDYQDIQIDTPYGQLTYPGEWQDYLEVTHTQEADYQLSFAAKVERKQVQPLFDILFSDNGELGVICWDGNMIGVSLVMHDFVPDASWTDAQSEIVFSMLETANEVIAQLDIKGTPKTDSPEELEPTRPEVLGETVADEITPTELIVQTPYGQIKYPGKWISNINTEVVDTVDYVVAFYGTVGCHERVHLFSVCFGDAVQTPIGTVCDSAGNEVNVGILPSDFRPEDWSAEESSMFYEMMEDVNYVISALLRE